jgi:hypothetical protein
MSAYMLMMGNPAIDGTGISFAPTPPPVLPPPVTSDEPEPKNDQAPTDAPSNIASLRPRPEK